MELFDFKANDIGSVMEIGSEIARAQQRRFLETITDVSGWAVSPLKAEEIQMQLVASNKVVWVTKSRRDSVLRSIPETGIKASIPLFLAPVNGRWTVVR